MFALLYEVSKEKEKVFKIFQSYEEAQRFAENVACLGYAVTLFDYDEVSDIYLEFYTI